MINNMTKVERSVSVSISKNLFLSIVYSKDITYKKNKRGVIVERTDAEKEKQMDLILSGHKPGIFREKMGEVIQYLNTTMTTMVPITHVEIIS